MTVELIRISLGIVCEGKDVLLVERAQTENGEGLSVLKWSFPGGKIEDGESAEEAAVREVREETGFKVTARTIINEVQHPQFPVFVSYIGCRLIGGSAEANNDSHIRQSRWVARSEAPGLFSSSLNEKVLVYLEQSLQD